MLARRLAAVLIILDPGVVLRRKVGLLKIVARVEVFKAGAFAPRRGEREQ